MKKILIIIVVLIIAIIGIAEYINLSNKPEQEIEKTNINIATLKGPTGIGMVKLMEDNSTGSLKNNYNVSIVNTPDEIVSKVIAGELDIAAVPTNLAATLYNKTEGKVQVLGINTLGVLSILDNTGDITGIDDLKGRTIYATGQAAVPEYVLNYILEANGITDANVEYLKEHSELATKAVTNGANICMLPEPFSTTVLEKNNTFERSIDLTKEWENATNNESTLPMGAIIVRKDFAEQNKKAVDSFLDEYKASIEYVKNNITDAANLSSKYEIIPDTKIAEKAIPNCNITLVTGQEMKTSISKFIEILFNKDPKSIGGKLPNEEFYYSK